MSGGKKRWLIEETHKQHPKKKIMAKMIHNYQDLHKKRKTSVDVSSNGNLLLS